MNALLHKLYNDPKTGFISANKLYKKAKAIDSKVTLKKVQEWYKTQANIQQYSNQNRKYPEFKLQALIQTNGKWILLSGKSNLS